MRMLVDPVRVRDGNLVGCTGVTMEDGTRYRANRRGHMDIEDKDHVYWMKRNGAGFVIESTGVTPRAPGTTCQDCGFHGFAFHASAPCPKCGGEMRKDQE